MELEHKFNAEGMEIQKLIKGKKSSTIKHRYLNYKK